jgi:hypothetical protein
MNSIVGVYELLNAKRAIRFKIQRGEGLGVNSKIQTI